MLIAQARAQGRTALSEPDAKSFLRAHGIPVPPGRVVREAGLAAAAAKDIGPPIIVKAIARDLTHKSDAGGVIGPLDTPDAAEAACLTIAERFVDRGLQGFLVEGYRPAQPEWILALRIDPHFGPTVMFGLGGIYVDILRQVSFRLAPLSEHDIDALISEQPAMRILDGARGKPAANRPALKDAIRCMSELAEHPAIIAEISEIEINPLTVTAEAVLALDALIVLRS
jgi:acetyl-CoA synthetase (ADP-forming)